MLTPTMKLRYYLLISVVIAATAGLWPASQAPARKVYPKRWVYVARSLGEDRQVEDIREIVRTASEHGLNGMVLAGSLDRIDIQPPEYFDRLRKIKEICERYRVEIIPTGFNVGYGGSLLAHDRNLAAGLPVKDALFVARHGEARFQQDSDTWLENGSFEQHGGGGIQGFTVQGAFGKTVLVDGDTAREGRFSVRFEHNGAARVEQILPVKPYRCYRVKAWVRTESIAPRTPFAGPLSIRAYAPDRRNLSYFQRELPAASDWREVAAGFNSWYADRVTLSIGADHHAGKLWIDGVRIEEVGLVNVIRREGTPIRVRNEKSGRVYEEGRDYARIEDPKMDFRFGHDGPAIKLTRGGRIRNGDRLRVDYYHGTTIYRHQVGACLSDPKVLEIWRKQFPIIHREIAPKAYLLALDEVRVGGFCENCRERKKTRTMGQMLGDYATRLFGMIREVNPAAEVFVWSDMFDPNHNARAQYYLVDGDYTGSWNYLPKDIQIACWYYGRRRESLDHFSKLGFRTLAGAYYDADDLRNPEGWLEALDATPGAVGIMYTTWMNKYGLLAAFGDLVSKR